MRSLSATLLSCGSATAVILAASSAFAHIDLLSPMPRYAVNRANGGGGSKECPCGGTLVDPDRICNVPADQSHDANRSNNVTTFEADSTITLRVDEYINHSGRFRVAFDADGADMTDFNSKILLDVPDDKQGGTGVAYEFQVKLPNMTCENCTLQIIQDMNGNTTTPVADPSKDSTYYNCADIRLVPPGTMGTDDGMDDGDNMDDPAMPNPTPGGMGTNPMGAGNGMSAGMTGGGLGSVPPMGDSAATGNGTMMPATGTSSTSTAVGSLMPTTAAPTSAPMGTPALMGSNSDADSSGGCSLGSRSGRAPASPLAALAVAGVFALFAGRRRRLGQS